MQRFFKNLRWPWRKKRPKSPKKVFTDIFENNSWENSESVSGVGSTLENTKALRQALPGLIEELGVGSILDLPCGDFHWMKEVDLGEATYLGADIVEELVLRNRERFGREGIDFQVLDILSEPLPACDLVIIRDLFNHFPNDLVREAFENLLASGSGHLLVGHYTAISRNRNTPLGGNRLIHFELPPFSFPSPARIIEEDFAPHKELGRSMALWRLEDLRSCF